MPLSGLSVTAQLCYRSVLRCLTDATTLRLHMKAERRHDLETNSLAKVLTQVPEFFRRHGAKALLAGVLGYFTWLRLLWVDGGYSGPAFAQWVKGLRRKLVVAVIKRSDAVRGFQVLPRRWVVERTFGWLMRQRRLVRDYETSESSAEAWVYIAMIRIQLRRLA